MFRLRLQAVANGSGELPCKMAGRPASAASAHPPSEAMGVRSSSCESPSHSRTPCLVQAGWAPYLTGWGAAGWLLGSPEMERCWALPETEEKGSAADLVRKAGWVGTFGPGHLGDRSFPKCYFYSETTMVLH